MKKNKNVNHAATKRTQNMNLTKPSCREKKHNYITFKEPFVRAISLTKPKIKYNSIPPFVQRMLGLKRKLRAKLKQRTHHNNTQICNLMNARNIWHSRHSNIYGKSKSSFKQQHKSHLTSPSLHMHVFQVFIH